ncbi:MAG TPA: adenylosuccinate lyase [Myxococcota bacterium]|nr:adenylosuccinate lyase [Myxococcota bacterium]
MISRYTLPALEAVWSEDHRYALWTRIEVAVCRALAKRGEIPRDAFAAIESRAKVDPARVAEIEARVHHDVNAFLDALAEQIGPASRYVHLGLTSSDVLDTCLALQIAAALDLVIAECDRALAALERRALEFKHTVCVGRTHGIFAEPTTFGLKLLRGFDELARGRERLARARSQAAVGKLSGAVGTFAHLDPAIEEEVLGSLGLGAAPISTQVVSRDRHAEVLSALAQAAGAVEAIAVEMRHLARSEVGEVQEFFGSEQKGSSAMPHKRNPWRFETLTGLARVVRGYAVAGLENTVLWHERDISNSSVERVVFPDATAAVHFMMHRLADLIDSLEVHPQRMRENLDSARGLVFSQAVLLALAKHGVSRQEAYRLVQKHALSAWDQGEHFYDRLAADAELGKVLDPDELVECFDLERQLRNVDAIFARTLAAHGRAGR